MAKMNRLALARMALRYCIKELSREEKLCILADIYCPLRDGVRWTGFGGIGAAGLDQGIYSHMTSFRRISDLWNKLEALGAVMSEEVRTIRNLILGELSDGDREEILGNAGAVDDDPVPAPGEQRWPPATNSALKQGQLSLAVNYRDSPNGPFAPPADPKGAYSV